MREFRKIMREFCKDWKRWSRAERIVALMFVSANLIGLPAVLALNSL